MEEGVEPQDASLWRRILFSEGRTRVLWRVVVWILATRILFVALSAVLSGFAATIDGHTASEFTGELVMALSAGGAGLLVLAALDHHPLAAFGLAVEPRATVELARGLVGGALALTVAVALSAAWGVQFGHEAGDAAGIVNVYWRAALLFLVAAASEELLVRGYLYMALVERWGVWAATIVLSLIFAALHLGNPNMSVLSFANIFVAGIWLSWVYLRTRSLWAAIGAHAGWNWMQGVAWDLPVSGLRLFDTPGYDVHLNAPALIGGGVFGPEAGFAATVALTVATVWLVKRKNFSISERVRLARPLVESRMEKVA